MSPEYNFSQEAAQPVDYEQIGRQILEDMGVEDPSFGNLAVSAGDPEGKCVGTLAEAVGRHEALRSNVALIVEQAQRDGQDPEEAAKNNPFFNPYLAKNSDSKPYKVQSTEELKKNS
jgi:hypothetical protein